MTPTIWISPLDRCDICGIQFGTENPVMYDARIFRYWGNVCEGCFDSDPDAGLGIGRGQKYRYMKYDNKMAWVCVVGGDRNFIG